MKKETKNKAPAVYQNSFQLLHSEESIQVSHTCRGLYIIGDHEK